MRKYIRKYILLLLVFVLLGAGVFFFISKTQNKAVGQRQTLMNRVSNELTQGGVDNIETNLDSMLRSNSWAKEYGKGNVPSDIRFCRIDEFDDGYADRKR